MISLKPVDPSVPIKVTVDAVTDDDAIRNNSNRFIDARRVATEVASLSRIAAIAVFAIADTSRTRRDEPGGTKKKAATDATTT